MKINLIDTDNIQDENFKLHRPAGTADYLYVLFKSPAVVLIDGEYVEAKKNDFILFDKNSMQSYYPTHNTKFVHDFMHFDTTCAIEENLISDFPKNKLIHTAVSQDLSALLKEIKKENHNTFSKYMKNILSALGKIFIYKLKLSAETFDSDKRETLFSTLYDLRADIYNFPQNDWSIDKICAKLCISRSYLQHLYKKYFLVSIKTDIINARIEYAKILLSNSTLSIFEIAERSGYKNIEHFIRQFKKAENGDRRKFCVKVNNNHPFRQELDI